MVYSINKLFLFISQQFISRIIENNIFFDLIEDIILSKVKPSNKQFDKIQWNLIIFYSRANVWVFIG